VTAIHPTPGRYHAFDSLRATMMLLGFVLHGALSYVTFPSDDVWSYKDPDTTPLADLLVIGIHIFRMPIFFVMAGFFTALLVERRGISSMLRNRLMRVTLVLVVFLPLLVPAILGAAAFAVGAGSTGNGMNALRVWLRDGPFWESRTMHLWFLWYLTLFYVIAWVVTPIARLCPASARATLSRGFSTMLATPLRPLLLAIPFTVILYLQGGILRTATAFTPDPLVLAGYLLFFAFGWALWHHQPLIETLPKYAWSQVGIAAVLLPLTVVAQLALVNNSGGAAVLTASVLGAVIVWLLVFGISGLTIRFARHERPVMRYLTDASYWMYLVHLPFMLLVPGLLAPLALPVVVKMLIVIISVSALMLLSYHFLVRDTAIGLFLNGRRYPSRNARNVRPSDDPAVGNGTSAATSS
jgi:glucan biosynthesis protein C